MQLQLTPQQELRQVKLVKRELRPSLSACTGFQASPQIVLCRSDINGKKTITAQVAGNYIEVNGPKADFELGEEFAKISLEAVNPWMAWKACQQLLRDRNLLDANDKPVKQTNPEDGVVIHDNSKGVKGSPQFGINYKFHPRSLDQDNYLQAKFTDGKSITIQGTAPIFKNGGHVKLHEQFLRAASPDISEDDLELTWDLNDPDETLEGQQQKLSPNARPWEYLKDIVKGQPEDTVLIVEAPKTLEELREHNNKQIEARLLKAEEDLSLTL